MQAIIATVQSGVPWRDEIERRFAAAKPWLRDIILSPKRRAFFDLLPRKTRRILDVGCGWGQMTLPLAAEGREIVALEPEQHRLAFVEAAAHQEGVANKIAFVGADFLDCDFKAAFDAILSIGVLEWIGVFHERVPPRESQLEFLRRARHSLAAGGVLVLGIENRIGAKYLLGCPDDHIGVPGIACLPADAANARWNATTGHDLRSFTYTELELRDMLRAAGFSSIRVHAAFPDYKLPEWIVSTEDAGAALNERLLTQPHPPERNGFDGSLLADEFQQRLRGFYQDTARAGIARHFVPSFFVLAQ